jgi:hypothetical protein
MSFVGTSYPIMPSPHSVAVLRGMIPRLPGQGRMEEDRLLGAQKWR